VSVCVRPAASPMDTGAQEENKQGPVSDAKPKHTSGTSCFEPLFLLCQVSFDTFTFNFFLCILFFHTAASPSKAGSKELPPISISTLKVTRALSPPPLPLTCVFLSRQHLAWLCGRGTDIV
jgi:hypothetical protein